jgi:toxin secretion/phage lysis holin
MIQLKILILNIITASIGNSSKDAAFRSLAATSGLIATDWLGGWDKALQFLFIAMLIDYITGILGAVKSKNLDSDVMFWGGIRKVTVLIVVGMGDMLDGWLQPGTPIFRTTAIYFYSGREGLSIVENLGKLNVPMPTKLKDILQQLNDKDKQEAKQHDHKK